ncbi:hypothetical protein ANN_00764 [Periplaneta americana]|uniref:Uncharacterized protein n=1 Tax=Periplaneta americana TaxID=6978 RepID=A0ABQ8TRN8_PERAM|nr:hypothetical protein ANN_00764 [Periplaneta americana]
MLRVLENKVLRKIFGAKRDEITKDWRKLHNAELHALCSSPDIIRNIKSRRLMWAGHIARMGKSRNAYRVLVGRPEGERPLERSRHRWEDDIKMNLREVGYDDRDWINLAQDRDQWRAYVRAAMNLRINKCRPSLCVALVAALWLGAEASSLQEASLASTLASTLECHRRVYAQKVTKTDSAGRECWDVVKVMSCWGRCDSNELMGENDDDDDDDDDGDGEEERKGNPVPARSLLLSKSTKV